eukprot:26691-Eustigmatos_ZCMA.PRE.1
MATPCLYCVSRAGQSHSLEARVQPAFAHAVSRLLTKFDPKQASKAGKKCELCPVLGVSYIM